MWVVESIEEIFCQFGREVYRFPASGGFYQVGWLGFAGSEMAQLEE